MNSYPRASLFPLQVLKLLQALGADVLALEDGDVLAAVTENAAGTVLFENDGGTLHIDFQCVLLRDVQRAAHLNGQDNAPQFIYLSDNSS